MSDCEDQFRTHREKLFSNRDPNAVQTLKCFFLNFGHDWKDHDFCQYCGKVKPWRGKHRYD